MFWGYVLKEGKPFQTKQVLEDNDYPLLHLSHAALPKNTTGGGKVYLLASQGKDLQNMTLTCLQKDKIDSASLDLYINITQNLTLSVQGAPELHLSGYFEPNRDELDEGGLMLDEDEDELDEEEEEEGLNGKVNKNLKQAQ